MAMNPAAGMPASTTCRICGRAAPRGAKLCNQCKAAVKRARQVPTIVSQFLPVPAMGAAAHARDVARHRAPRVPVGPRLALAPFPGGWGAFAMLVTFGAGICFTGYLAINEVEDEARIARVASTTMAGAVGHRGVAIAQPQAQQAEDMRRDAQGEPGPPETDLAVRPATGAWLARSTRRGATGNARASRLTQPSGAVDPRDVADVSATMPAVSVEAVPADAAAPASAPDAREPAPDRWQMMNAAIARCSGERFLAGVLCEQRERLRYCDGLWGAAPQCPGGFRLDSGR